MPVLGSLPLTSKLFVVSVAIVVFLQLTFNFMLTFWSKRPSGLILATSLRGIMAQPTVDLRWHAPAQTEINNLKNVIDDTGVYGFIYNTSDTPDELYGQYNWCNMPHVRASEYIQPSSEYELQYVEVIQRHHKRTPYASNGFPVEPYPWHCDDTTTIHTIARPSSPFPQPAEPHRNFYTSPTNPFPTPGWQGTCLFPQITADGLLDAHQHGADLYSVYGTLLGLLPARSDPSWRDRVSYRVTNNPITSQVAGMLVAGMWQTTDPVPVGIQASAIDSLEPRYFCPLADSLFGAIRSGGNADWAGHLSAARGLYARLDGISGVAGADPDWHGDVDHYYDNLSARQCHSMPLPCAVDGADTTMCVTQEMADAVYRLGHWEYSRMYRDAGPASLAACATGMGVWFAELAGNIRGVVNGGGRGTGTVYRHNVAHDGSLSRVLGFLQVEGMVWPGMGSEVIFELWRRTGSTGTDPPTATVLSTGETDPTVTASAAFTNSPRQVITITRTGTQTCSRNDCLRQMVVNLASPSSFCPEFTADTTTAVPTWLGNCGDDSEAVSSACSCLVDPASSGDDPSGTDSNAAVAGTGSGAAPTATTGNGDPTTQGSGYYVRVLWGGRTMRSSNPSLGLMEMVPVETLLGYIDGLVGVDARHIVGKCNGSIRIW